VNVNATGVSTTISSGGGHDTVNVGFNGGLQDIQGALTVKNPPSFTTLNIDDSADTAARKVTIDSGAITGLAPVVISYIQNDLHALTIDGGTKGDTFTVVNTPTNGSNPVTTLDTGGGDDKVMIQATPGTLVVLGGAGNDTLVGPNQANTWNLSSFLNTLGNVVFGQVENLTGGTGNDRFNFLSGGVSGKVDGGAGNDTLDYSAYGVGVTVNLQTSTAPAIGSFAHIEGLVGSPAFDTLVGPNTPATNTWTITGTNAGAVKGFNFAGIENLTGGTATDVFKFSAGMNIFGTLDGGGGHDWLDYALYATPVTVNLTTKSATGVGGIVANIQNVRGSVNAVNTLTGNALGNILIGGTKADTLTGGSGRSILIGGKGIDTVTGGADQDILIGGYTTYDPSSLANDLALESILDEWQSGGSPSDRHDHIVGSKPGGLNGSNFLKLGTTPGTTVRDDNGANTLTDGAGPNWFFAHNKSDCKGFNQGTDYFNNGM
jgi:hypothetical protein